MTKKELEKSIESITHTLTTMQCRIDGFRLCEYREPRERIYEPPYGSYDASDVFELKDVVTAILDHLNLRLSKTKIVPEKTMVVKKDAPPTP